MPTKVFDIQFHDEENDPISFGAYASHILAEGDSWFAWAQLSGAPSSNLLRELTFADKTMVINCAYSGDVIDTMGRIAQNPLFFNEMKAAKYEAILLSGGGNDLIDALHSIIIPAPGAARAADYVDTVSLSRLLGRIADAYDRILAFRDTTINAGVPIVLHTYDYPTPRPAPAIVLHFGKVGPWLITAMQGVVPVALWPDITVHIYNQLRDTLLSLHDPARGLYVVPTCGILTRAAPNTTAVSNDWRNEIHPTDAGFAKLAAPISALLHGLGLR